MTGQPPPHDPALSPACCVRLPRLLPPLRGRGQSGAAPTPRHRPPLRRPPQRCHPVSLTSVGAFLLGETSPKCTAGEEIPPLLPHFGLPCKYRRLVRVQYTCECEMLGTGAFMIISIFFLISKLYFLQFFLSTASLLAQMVKNLPAMKKTQVRSLGWKDSLEKSLATHSSILA